MQVASCLIGASLLLAACAPAPLPAPIARSTCGSWSAGTRGPRGRVPLASGAARRHRGPGARPGQGQHPRAAAPPARRALLDRPALLRRAAPRAPGAGRARRAPAHAERPGRGDPRLVPGGRGRPGSTQAQDRAEELRCRILPGGVPRCLAAPRPQGGCHLLLLGGSLPWRRTPPRARYPPVPRGGGPGEDPADHRGRCPGPWLLLCRGKPSPSRALGAPGAPLSPRPWRAPPGDHRGRDHLPRRRRRPLRPGAPRSPSRPRRASRCWCSRCAGPRRARYIEAKRTETPQRFLIFC
jgi:hypothetical protein